MDYLFQMICLLKTTQTSFPWREDNLGRSTRGPGGRFPVLPLRPGRGPQTPDGQKQNYKHVTFLHRQSELS